MKINQRFAIWIGILAVLCVLAVAGLTACDQETGGAETAATTVTTSEGDTETDVTSAAATSTGAVMSTEVPTSTNADGTTEEIPTTDEPTGNETERVTDEPDEETSQPTGGGVVTLPPETEKGPYESPDFNNVPRKTLPLIKINTASGSSISSTTYYSKATVEVTRCDDSYAMENLSASVRVRGNSTAAAPKKPYRIKFDTKQSLLGLADGEKYRNWCLMADYYDHSMLRTWAAFSFADVLLEGKYYSSDCTPVEVMVNGQYMGVYLLCEHTQINDGRVDIPKREDGDTSLEIGYLMIGQGGRADEPDTVILRPNITIRDRVGSGYYYNAVNVSLSGGDYTEAQKQYVNTYVSAVFRVVAAALYENEYYTLSRDGTMTPKTDFIGTTEEEKQYETIDAVFNIEAAVGMCILDEIVKNLDGHTFNMYVDLSPTGDGRVTLAAPWDFDFAMANTFFAVLHGTSGFSATNLTIIDEVRVNPWHAMLGSIPWFEDLVRERWIEHYDELRAVADGVLVNTQAYKFAYARDYNKWGKPMDRMLISHHCTDDLNGFGTHYAAGKFLREWLVARLEWLNSRWGSEATEPVPAERLEIDFTQESSASCLSGFHNCSTTVTSDGLRARMGRNDPYFTVNVADYFDRTLMAEDYAYLELTFKVPAQYATRPNRSEIFLMVGDVSVPTPGISVAFMQDTPTGQYQTYRIDLSAMEFWKGEIHSVRIDFFHSGQEGDYLFIKSLALC